MNKRLYPVLLTVLLDAMGVGLTLPILPALLREFGHGADLGWRFGAFLGLYALMQFLFSPLLGALSDKFGRRPVLLLSLGGAAIDYLFTAFAPSLTLLFLGRAIAGATSASMAVATAYVADVTPEDQRARGFGQLTACVGLGYIAGPLLGGLLGESWIRAPFMAAAALNATNLLLVLLLLLESRAKTAGTAAISYNPFAPIGWAFSFPALVPLIAVFVVISLAGQVGNTIWVLYGEDRFGWSPLGVGISLAGFGLLTALAQAFVAGPMSERMGERRAMLIGLATDGAAYLLMAFTTAGWMAFVLLPLFCLAGVATPALQSLLSGKVNEEHQGRLQGVLASLGSLSAIAGPVLISTGYFASRGSMPGGMWLAGAALYLLCLPVLFSRKATPDRRAAPAPLCS